MKKRPIYVSFRRNFRKKSNQKIQQEHEGTHVQAKLFPRVVKFCWQNIFFLQILSIFQSLNSPQVGNRHSMPVFDRGSDKLLK